MKPAISGTGASVFRIVFILCILGTVTGIKVCPAQKNPKDVRYRKILILTKIKQPEIERQFENSMVSALKDKGYFAVPSYNTFTKSEIENTSLLVAKADSMQIDALLAFTLIDVETKIINQPQVSANVGIPVQIGFFSVYVGTSVPLGGGPKEEKTVTVKAGLYTDRNSPEPSWTLDLTGSLSNGNDALIYDFTRKTVKALIKQKVL